MPTCGKCHATDQSIDHIRACYELDVVRVSNFAKQYLESQDFRPMALGDSEQRR
jgi:hypothetical protein